MSFLNKIKGWGQDRNASAEAMQAANQQDAFDDVAQQAEMPLPDGHGTMPLEVPTMQQSVGADSSIITEAAPSEMAEFSETRIQEAAAAAAGTGLPMIGDRPIAQQQRILSIMVGVGLVGLIAMTVWSLVAANRGSAQVAASGQALMQSQRLAKSVSQALIGSASAFPEVKESAEIVEWSAKELAAMGPPSRNEWIMAALVLLAMFFWICGSNPNISLPLLGSNFINATMVVFVVISLMLVTGVIVFEDIVSEKSAWEVFFYFTSLLTLSSGLNEIGFIKWVAEGYAKPLAGLSPTMGMILLVSFFFWIHYFFSSITSHTAAVLPVVLAVGTSIPGLSVSTLMLLCVYSLGLMGVISPYATGPAPMYFGSGYIGKRDFWKFGLIFGMIYFAGLILIVLPWLQLIG